MISFDNLKEFKKGLVLRSKFCCSSCFKVQHSTLAHLVKFLFSSHNGMRKLEFRCLLVKKLRFVVAFGSRPFDPPKYAGFAVRLNRV